MYLVMCRFPFFHQNEALCRGRSRSVDIPHVPALVSALVLAIAAVFLSLAGGPAGADELQGPGARPEQSVTGAVVESAPGLTQPISIASRIGPLVAEGARAGSAVRRSADWTLWDHAGTALIPVAAVSADRGSKETLATSHADVSMFSWREAVLAALVVVCVLVALLACTRNGDRHRTRHF